MDGPISSPGTNRRKGNKAPDLVNNRNDGGKRQDLFLQLFLGEVRDSYAFDLSGVEKVLHLFPGIFEFPVEQDVTTGTIWEGGEIWVISVRVEGNLMANAITVR